MPQGHLDHFESSRHNWRAIHMLLLWPEKRDLFFKKGRANARRTRQIWENFPVAQVWPQNKKTT